MVKTLLSNAGGSDLIPGQGDEIPHAICYDQKKKKESDFCPTKPDFWYAFKKKKKKKTRVE